MAITKVTDIYDPEVLTALIPQNWASEARLIQAGVLTPTNLAMSGTIQTVLRSQTFQNRSRQAVASGDEISATKINQTAENMPKLWGYDSLQVADPAVEVMEKDIPGYRADMADDIRIAAAHYVDDSAIAVVEGVGAALTSNQSGDGSAVTLSEIVDGKAALGEKGLNLDGGAMVMRPEIYWKMVKESLVSATENTFGNDLQNVMVLSGKLPVNVLGLTPVISRKISLAGDGSHYVYLLGQNTLKFGGSTTPEIETARLASNGVFGMRINFKVLYTMGVTGVSWTLAGKETVTDTELAAAGNWSLTALQSSDVALSRVNVDVS